MKECIKLMRPQHYIKNFLIFFPAFFAGNLFNGRIFNVLLVGSIAFSMITSTVYIINDIRDKEKDRLHAVKKNRPIASGKISEKKAAVFAASLLLLGEYILYLVQGTFFNKANGIVVLYLICNLAYSWGLKDKPIIDVLLLASGFVLRTLLGGALAQVEVSQWFALTIMMFSLYMGLGKRRNELKKVISNETRAVLGYYTYDFLNRYMMVSMTLGMVFYAYWCAAIAHNSHMVWTLPLTMAIIMKYELDLEKDSYGDPVEVLLGDKALLVIVSIYLVSIGIFRYGI